MHLLANLSTTSLRDLRKNDRFTGKVEKNILNYFYSYDKSMHDHNISHALKANYLHNLGEDEANILYRKQVQPYNPVYEVSKVQLLLTYCNAARQKSRKKISAKFESGGSHG